MPDEDAYQIFAPTSPDIRLSRLGARRYLLSVSGYFEQGWQGRLAAGLAKAGLGIVNGFFIADGFGLWRGEMEFDRSGSSTDPDDLDFGHLMNEPAADAVGHLAPIDQVSLTRVSEYNVSLRLAVRGTDSIGFLAALLAQCASHDLYPLELRVRTTDGKIDDLAFLKTSTLAPPLPEQERALRGWLSRRAHVA